MPSELRLIFLVGFNKDLDLAEIERIAGNLCDLPERGIREGLVTREEEDITLDSFAWQVEAKIDGEFDEQWVNIEELSWLDDPAADDPGESPEGDALANSEALNNPLGGV